MTVERQASKAAAFRIEEHASASMLGFLKSNPTAAAHIQKCFESDHAFSVLEPQMGGPKGNWILSGTNTKWMTAMGERRLGEVVRTIKPYEELIGSSRHEAFSGIPTSYTRPATHRDAPGVEFVDVTLTPLRADDGKIMGVLRAAKDVTELVKRDRTQRQARLESMMLARLEGEMDVGNNILMGVAGGVQSAISFIKADDVKTALEMLEIAGKGADRQTLLSNVQKRYFVGVASEPKQAVNVNTLLRDTLTAGKFQKLNIEIQEGDVPEVQINRGLAQECFEILAENAMEATEGKQKPGLRVQVGRNQRTGEVEVTFTDNGSGFAENLIAKDQWDRDDYTNAFMPYAKGYGKGTGKNGMGLFKAYGIIVRHAGGDIEISRTPAYEPKGIQAETVIKIKLPVAETQAETPTT